MSQNIFTQVAVLQSLIANYFREKVIWLTISASSNNYQANGKEWELTEMHKIKLRWQNQSQVTVISIIQQNASPSHSYLFLGHLQKKLSRFLWDCLYEHFSFTWITRKVTQTLQKKTVFSKQHKEIFISGILKCLLQLTILKCWIFNCTCLKVSQKQVFLNDQLLSKCLTKIRGIKGGIRHQVLSFTPKEVARWKIHLACF